MSSAAEVSRTVAEATYCIYVLQMLQLLSLLPIGWECSCSTSVQAHPNGLLAVGKCVVHVCRLSVLW